MITSCLRATTLNSQAKSPDPLYDVASTMWTIIEMSVAIICACLPQIRPLVVKLFPRLMPAYYHPGERSSHKPALGSSLVKSYDSRQQVIDEGRWARIECQDGINLTTIRKGDIGSELRSTNEEGFMSMGIRKTVQYSIEYSRHG
jgi:hypothetical protein